MTLTKILRLVFACRISWMRSEKWWLDGAISCCCSSLWKESESELQWSQLCVKSPFTEERKPSPVPTLLSGKWCIHFQLQAWHSLFLLQEGHTLPPSHEKISSTGPKVVAGWPTSKKKLISSCEHIALAVVIDNSLATWSSQLLPDNQADSLLLRSRMYKDFVKLVCPCMQPVPAGIPPL